MAPRRWPIALVILLAFMLAAPAAQATLPGFGGMVTGTTAGVVGELTPLVGATLGYLDVNPAGGGFDVANEAVILTLNGVGAAEVGDIVVTNPVAGAGLASACASTCAPGSAIISVPGGTIVALPAGTIRFVDSLPGYDAGGPNGIYDLGEPIFIDNDATGVAGSPDRLLVTGTGLSGSVGSALSGAQSEAVWDSPTECIYVSSDGTQDGADTLVSEDSVPTCAGATLSQTVSNIHISGADNTFDSGEAAYISSDAVISTGDFRVTDGLNGGPLAGTLVNCGNFGADADCGFAALQSTALANAKLSVASKALPAPAFGWFDVNGDSARDINDKIVMDLDANGYITPIDVRFNSGSQTFAARPVFGDADVHMPLGLAITPTLMWLDDGDNTVEATEPIAFDFNGDTFLSVGDICVTAVGGCPAGAQRIGSHSAGSGAWDATAANGPIALAYSDINNNGHLDAASGEAVYIHIGALPGTSTALDVVLATDSGGSGARATAGIALKAFAAGFSGFDADKSGTWTVGDVAVLDQDANSLATISDVRINNGGLTGLSGFGKILKEGDADTLLALLDPAESAAPWAFRDQTSGGFSADDPIMLMPRATACPFAGNDVIISKGASTLSSGAFVSAGYSGCEAIALPAGPGFAYTAGTYSTASKVYLNLNGPTATAPDTTLSTGDVCIVPTSGTPGTRIGISGGCPDTGTITNFAALYLRVVDMNGDGIAAAGDALVLDADNDGLFTAGDVMISGTATAVTSTPVNNPNNPPATSVPTTPTNPTSTATPTATASSAAPTTNSDGTFDGTDLIEDANQGLLASLKIELKDGQYILTWTRQDGITGYQVWGHASPYVLLATINDPSVTAASFPTADGTLGYMVTAFHGSDGNLTAAQVNAGQVPGLPAGLAPSGVDVPGPRSPIPGPGLVLAAAALALGALAARRRLA